ncbi:LysR family transcriptional regulator [Brevibacterium renqingii]|uniref:LysR family transcriptional regulator n=1 Tax=Brevibacterium renqingii TaxID=2776916 RepID=UPI001AE0D2A8|nr:LysR family transcriptional regulator [Brevibacterium renqingii]
MSTELSQRHLRTFIAVSSEESFTRAARRLGMSQSAVSSQIRQLEATVDMPLLSRDTHSVELTPAGERLLSYAQRITATMDEAILSARDLPQRERVRFGVSEDFAFTHLPDFLERLRSELPNLEVVLSVELSATLHRQLRAGELDIILAMRPPASVDSVSFASSELFTDALAWVARPGFGLEEEEPIPLVLYPRPSVTREIALDVLERHGHRFATAATSTSLAGLRAAVLGGLGIMPFAKSLIPEGAVVMDEPRLPGLPDLTFVVVTRNPSTRAAAAVASVLQRHSPELRTRRPEGAAEPG